MKSRTILLGLLGFLAIGALGGGGVLIISPSGSEMGIPLSVLSSSPFSTFLIPGIILFFIISVIPVVLIFALLRKPNNSVAQRLNAWKDMHWSWTFTVYMAFTLIIWIQLEMMFLQAVHWLHTFYIIYAIAIIFVALRPQIRNQYKTLR